jgi:hypothetical protein
MSGQGGVSVVEHTKSLNDIERFLFGARRGGNVKSNFGYDRQDENFHRVERLEQPGPRQSGMNNKMV